MSRWGAGGLSAAHCREHGKYRCGTCEAADERDRLAARQASAGLPPVWIDADGYPTQALLDKLQELEPLGDLDEQMKFLASVWWGSGARQRRPGDWVFSTGGWSGNEDMVRALRANSMWWAMNWYSSRRGGRFRFKAIR